ncbi:MAG: hypothetical protein AAFX81_02735 [Pseudomonadota bacterium]
MTADALADVAADPRGERVAFDDLAAFVAGPGVRLALIAGEPGRRPETQDVAVVVRELLRDASLALRVAVVEGELSAERKEAFDLRIEPSLILARDGTVREVIPGIKDWAVYHQRLKAMFEGNA